MQKVCGLFALLPKVYTIYSASRGNLAKQVGQLSEKRGSLMCPKSAEEDGPRCDPDFSSVE